MTYTEKQYLLVHERHRTRGSETQREKREKIKYHCEEEMRKNFHYIFFQLVHLVSVCVEFYAVRREINKNTHDVYRWIVDKWKRTRMNGWDRVAGNAFVLCCSLSESHLSFQSYGEREKLIWLKSDITYINFSNMNVRLIRGKTAVLSNFWLIRK